MSQTFGASEALAREVRLFVFGQAAESARVPQPYEIAVSVAHQMSGRISK